MTIEIVKDLLLTKTAKQSDHTCDLCIVFTTSIA